MTALAFDTFEDVLSALVEATQDEHAAKFAQGDVLALACDVDQLRTLGYVMQEDLLRDTAKAIGRQRRTLYKRLLVSRTFAESDRDDRLSWEAHYLCATTDNPLGWLKNAADQEMTTDQLRAAIKAAGGDPGKGERVYLVRAADAVVAGLAADTTGFQLVLDFDRDIEIEIGQRVVVTIAYDPDPEPVQATALEEMIPA